LTLSCNVWAKLRQLKLTSCIRSLSCAGTKIALKLF